MNRQRRKKIAVNELLEENRKLKELVAEQSKQLEQLQSENKTLREELEKLTKTNSSTHPSTPSGMIPTYKKPDRKGRRKKPGRKKGHPGTRRKTPDRIDETVTHELDCCPDCGGPLGKPFSPRTRIIEELPPVQTVITEHVIYRYHCPNCKKTVEPAVDAALPGMRIGNRLLTMTIFMHYFMGVTINNIRTWLATFASLDISAGGLTSAWKRTAQRLKPLYDSLETQARKSDVIYADETGWRVSGQNKWWLWCFTNTRLAYYVIIRSRGSPVVVQVLGKMFGGTLVSDFLGVYNIIDAAAKQRCLVHLFRELKKVLDKNASPEWSAFCKRLKRLLRDAMRLCKRRESIPAEEFASKKKRLHLRLKKLYCASYSDKDCRRIVKRLSRCKDELFTFVDNPLVRADNNHAERQIRPAVVMRKNSYCNRSEDGAQTQAIFMSLLRTLHLRDIDPVDTLCAALKASIISGELPPLPDSPVSLG